MPASGKPNRLLQAREIRRNDFSVAFSYPLRVSTELRKAAAQAAESKAERAALLCEVQPVNSLIQRYSKYLVLIKAYYVIFELFHFNNETKRSKLVFRACFCYLWERRSLLCK